jgi:hypothetical protein
MMYSQQEYDMVRRQTMQIEAEKRTLLRWALISISVLFAASLILTGWMYRRYSVADNLIRGSEIEAADAKSQLQEANRELAEKRAILERNSAALAKQNAVITSIMPRMLSGTASEGELAMLAQAIYDQPGHVIQVPGVPPNKVLRSYWLRTDGRPAKYTLVPGLLNGKQVLYSLLVKNQLD